MIIPIFIPHEGCPNDCAFCNQRTISGQNKAPQEAETVNIIESYLETMGEKARQIAFFGGSFTGIDKEKQNRYLSIAEKYIVAGKIDSIRLSTRPDYIDEDTLKRLLSYGVKNIELGAQSMDDDVLTLSRRGHTAQDVEKAAELINKSGAVLGLQMMTGLPGDNEEKCLYTAKKFFELGAKETRIYPTVILSGTHLAKMYEMGQCTAQSVEEAIGICAKLYRYFNEKNIKILRIGLADSYELREQYIAGAYHPSLGEMVISRDIRNRIEEAYAGGKKIEIHANKSFLSKIIGNKKCNLTYFRDNNIDVTITLDSEIEKFSIRVKS